MRNFIFISRHEPLSSQFELAAAQGVNLIHVGDLDAFDKLRMGRIAGLAAANKAEGVVAVHPLIAIAAFKAGLAIGSFNNVNRAPIGQKPDFHTTEFQIEEVQ